MPDVSPAERVEQIREREKAATGEPWRWSDDRVRDLTGTYRAEGQEPYETYVVEAAHEGECACRSLCRLDLFVSDADAEFIAEARSDIPWLLAEVDALKQQLREARGYAQQHCSDSKNLPGLLGMLEEIRRG